ncbi:hypothetical protein FUA48_11790 [Flavobacterium alkalisoli]|uniref:Lipoprotein n=1 Tax=Flavobacterium alkalisoli TaxID=2602769 RepID=A0A5B9FTQ4_9FLAO|nr:hypothetical protein [Flavobacterium alkalisoli]QEE50234.1 hypothetical protein FUA48_11790 [Flavobacterium alkalisoli]
MKKAFLFLFPILLLSCNKGDNSLNVIITRVDPNCNASINLLFLDIKTSDSLFYKIKGYEGFDVNDTIKLINLPDDEYELKYFSMLGDYISRKIKLNDGDSKTITIVYDSIYSDNYINKTPIYNLRSGSSYTISRSGGCMASMTSSYTIKREGDNYYDINKDGYEILLTDKMKKAIQKFEAELLAIKGKNECNSTGMMTYVINSSELKDTIMDKTCNWQGFENMSHIYFKEYIDNQ